MFDIVKYGFYIDCLFLCIFLYLLFCMYCIEFLIVKLF